MMARILAWLLETQEFHSAAVIEGTASIAVWNTFVSMQRLFV